MKICDLNVLIFDLLRDRCAFCIISLSALIINIFQTFNLSLFISRSFTSATHIHTQAHTEGVRQRERASVMLNAKVVCHVSLH